MKILLFEDERASIDNALKQLAGHEVVVATTVFEFLAAVNALNTWDRYNFKFDAIVTDVNVPMGDAGVYDVGNYCSKDYQVAAGLVAVLAAVLQRVPCFVVTDSNSHKDLIGFLLDKFPQDGEWRENDLVIHTRPERLSNSGKDYSFVIEWLKEHSKTRPCPS